MCSGKPILRSYFSDINTKITNDAERVKKCEGRQRPSRAEAGDSLLEAAWGRAWVCPPQRAEALPTAAGRFPPAFPPRCPYGPEGGCLTRQASGRQQADCTQPLSRAGRVARGRPESFPPTCSPCCSPEFTHRGGLGTVFSGHRWPAVQKQEVHGIFSLHLKEYLLVLSLSFSKALALRNHICPGALRGDLITGLYPCHQ